MRKQNVYKLKKNEVSVCSLKMIVFHQMHVIVHTVLTSETHFFKFGPYLSGILFISARLWNGWTDFDGSFTGK